MTISQQVGASFMGTFFGFIFALILFFVTNNLISRRNKKNLRKHLKRELEYDISLISEWIEEIGKILRKVTSSDLKVFSYLQYSYFQSYFMQEAFKTGLMYNSLDNDDISQLNRILVRCNMAGERHVNSYIQEWQKQLADQKSTLDRFEFERDQLQKFKRQLKSINLKI